MGIGIILQMYLFFKSPNDMMYINTFISWVSLWFTADWDHY